MKVFGWIMLGMIAGVTAWGLVRFAAEPWPHPPHYHANWLVLIDGEPVDLSGDRYMHDVVACAATDDVTPGQRVHMHNGEGDVVHVHHSGVTWGHLLQNLGFEAGPDHVRLGDGVRLSNEGGRAVHYVINGFVRDDIVNAPIRSGDRLLISYDSASAEQVVAEQFPTVPDNAEEYNSMQDPATCSGAAESGVLDRLRRAFWG